MLKDTLLTLALATTVVALATAGPAQAATDDFLKVTPAAGTGEQIVGETVDTARRARRGRWSLART